MKKIIIIAALSLLAACTQTNNGMSMNGEMQCCKMMMKDGKECPCCKDGKMKQGMTDDMMQQCQQMMKQCDMMQGGMNTMKPADAAKTKTTKADADHKAHHPQQ